MPGDIVTIPFGIHDVQYRLIPEFPGYAAGSDGSIWSHRNRYGKGGMNGTWHRIKDQSAPKGMRSVTLRQNGKTVTCRVHSLVLAAHIGPRPDNAECCHFPDRNPANNQLSNIRWGTRSDNREDQRKHGTLAIGNNHPQRKLHSSDILDIRRLHRKGFSARQIHERYNLSRGHIYTICRRKSWQSVIPIVVIPCRLASSRLPSKPLLDCGGKTLLQRTYDSVMSSELADGAWVTSGDALIRDFCNDNQIPFLESGDCRNGTIRCASVSVPVPHGIVVNVQSDEPMISGDDIDKLVYSVAAGNDIATLVAPLSQDDEMNPNTVKAAVENGRCHWFSRAPMAGAMSHVGIYAFRRDVLQQVAELPQSSMGAAESLEQLDWIVAGIGIKAVHIDSAPLSINTQSDLDEYRKQLMQPNGKGTG